MRLVAPLIFGDAPLLTQPVAVVGRLIPRHPVDGAVVGWRIGRVVVMLLVEDCLVKLAELCHGHFPGGNGKGSTYSHLVLAFALCFRSPFPTSLGGRRTHQKLYWTWQHR